MKDCWKVDCSDGDENQLPAETGCYIFLARSPCRLDLIGACSTPSTIVSTNRETKRCRVFQHTPSREPEGRVRGQLCARKGLSMAHCGVEHPARIAQAPMHKQTEKTWTHPSLPTGRKEHRTKSRAGCREAQCGKVTLDWFVWDELRRAPTDWGRLSRCISPTSAL